MKDDLGHHLLFDCYGCRAPVLSDLAAVRELLGAAARAFGLTVIAEEFHQYQPQGVSGVLILAESHLAVHTWPEAELFSIYAAMAVVLIFRPEGLFLRVKARRI